MDYRSSRAYIDDAGRYGSVLGLGNMYEMLGRLGNPQDRLKYVHVAKAMLGRIAVIDNIDNAVKIARKYDYGVRMVTLEGELLVPGGAISGGAFRNNSNLLGRRREIDELGFWKKVLKQILSL